MNNQISHNNFKYFVKKININKKGKPKIIAKKKKIKIFNSLIKLLNYIDAIIKKS
jgi:hypothetical protein